MENNLEYQQVVYSVLKTQIQFGVYRYGERLPTTEDAARLFHVSVRPIRAAYQYLQHDGYITISKSVGVKVKVRFSESDIEMFIQTFFAQRKHTLIDLSRSMRPLLYNALWLGFRKASPELLDELEQFAVQKDLLLPYRMIQYLQLIYGSLGNGLLIRLVWQIFMFFLAPFLSVSENMQELDAANNWLLIMTTMGRQKKWAELQAAVEAFQEQLSKYLNRFYESRISLPPTKPQEAFYWSGYKKASQLCYSFGMEILIGINRGVYPTGSFLPSLNKLAKEKQVGVSTVRRTLALLNSIGATQSINGIGTLILPPEEITKNCDFSKPIVRDRLLEYAQSLHILTLSCRQVAGETIALLDEANIENWKTQLKACCKIQRYELLAYRILNLIAMDAPFMAIRTVYGELFQQLFWGYPLRSMLKEPETYMEFYHSYMDSFLSYLEQSDAAGFSMKLEELMLHELEFAKTQLVKMNIEKETLFFLSKAEVL